MKLFRTVFISTLLLTLLTGCINTQEPTLLKTTEKPSIPSPVGGKAVVYGVIRSKGTGRPPEDSFYLAKNGTADQPNLPAVMVFSLTSSPRAAVDEQGNFVFKDVDPGTYAMALWVPNLDPVFIEADDGRDYKWVKVGAGELLDIGLVELP